VLQVGTGSTRSCGRFSTQKGGRCSPIFKSFFVAVFASSVLLLRVC
jgi:hypothetical protein